MFSRIIIIAVALTVAWAQDGHEHGHHATSSQSIVLHQTHHEPQHHEYHVQPISYHHAAPVVEHYAPVVHHAAPVIHKVAPVVYKVAPVVHAAPAHHAKEHHEHYSHPKYEFAYHVEDKHTGDIKSQHETRDGDVVKGYYSLHEADGTTRIVHYNADKHSGFNAQVERKGHAKHIEPVHHKHH